LFVYVFIFPPSCLLRYYRALLNRGDKTSGFGNGNDDDDDATDAGSEQQTTGGALVAYTKPPRQGGPAFGSSRAARLGAVSGGSGGSDDDESLAAHYEVKIGRGGRGEGEGGDWHVAFICAETSGEVEMI